MHKESILFLSLFPALDVQILPLKNRNLTGPYASQRETISSECTFTRPAIILYED